MISLHMFNNWSAALASWRWCKGRRHANPVMRQNKLRWNASLWLELHRYGHNRDIHVTRRTTGLSFITLLYNSRFKLFLICSCDIWPVKPNTVETIASESNYATRGHWNRSESRAEVKESHLPSLFNQLSPECHFNAKTLLFAVKHFQVRLYPASIPLWPSVASKLHKTSQEVVIANSF